MSGVSLTVIVAHGDTVVEVDATDLGGYSTDVLDDVCKRAVRCFSDAVAHLRAHGIIAVALDDEAEEDDADPAT